MSLLEVKTMMGDNSSISQEDIDRFRGTFKGQLIDREHAEYNEIRSIWNGMIDRKPALIARCRDENDVSSAVKFARSHNLLISLRGGGHHVSGQSICDGGMVIDMSAMKKVEVDPESRTAQVQAGATLGDVDNATGEHNLAAPLGVVSATGVAGLTLHGGMGWLSRRHGLSLDNVLSMDVITSEGNKLRVSSDENSDLYWALRGGGGNFGAVTSFEFKLQPVSPKVWMLFSIYPISMAKKGLQFMRNYMPEAPEELGLISVFWSAPDEDFIPAKYRGEPVFIFLGCYHGSLEEGEKAIAPFRDMGEQVVDLSEPARFGDVQSLLDADYPDGRQYYWKSAYLKELSDDTIDRLIDHAKKRPSQLSSLDIWALGGAINRIDPQATAFTRRDARYMVGIEANWENPDDSDANVNWARNIYADMISGQDTGIYMNFPGFGEEGEDLLRKSYGENYSRLKQIKAKYDPDNFFCGFLSIK